MSSLLNEASRARAPISGRVAILTISTTPVRYAIPSAFAGKFATWVTVGADADLVCGTSAVTVTYQTLSSISSEAITVSPASGGHLTAGVPRWWMVPTSDEATHIMIDATAGGFLYIELATP